MRVSMKPSARLWVCTTLSWVQAVTSWAFVNLAGEHSAEQADD